jgi:hypothetical protein
MELARTSQAPDATEETNKEYNKQPKLALDAAGECLSSEVLSISDIEVAKNATAFSVLDLSGNIMFQMKHKEYCTILGAALKTNTQLREVHLSRCAIDTVDAKLLAGID